MFYEGAHGSPGVTDAVETVENQFWWNEYKEQVWFPSVISGAARDVGNTSYTTVLRPGLLLGRITATGKLVEWSPTATNGAQRIFGVLGFSEKMQRLGVDTDRQYGVMIAGNVKADRLIVPGSTDFGISGATNEFLIRAQMFPRFMFSDLVGGNPWGGWKNVEAKTADYTITEADNNTLFTNRGAAGAVILTLPTTAKKGLRYGLFVAANQNLKFTSGTADTMTTFNDLAADSVGFETANELIGGHLEVIGDGTGWLVIEHPHGAGATAQTITIAT